MPHRLWAFDSFCGFPPEAEGVPSRYHEGGINASAALALKDTTATFRIVEQYVNEPRVVMLKGMYSDVLTPELAGVFGMRPAGLVEIDCDLYISAFQALTWMVANELLMEGTLIFYDDWGACPEGNGGESLAHLKVLGDRCEEVVRWGQRPHVKVLFRVIE
jgi:hypothetical protein